MFITLKTHAREIARQTTENFLFFRERLGPRIGAKLQSEIISALLENAAVKVIPNMRGGAGDHEADLYLNDVSLELKAARGARVWRGGEYSKRAGDFLLVSWDMNEVGVDWCMVHVNLPVEAWKSSGNVNYYATTISLDDALHYGGRFLLGDAKVAKKNRHPIYEKIE
jgi:hypothetical protein